MPTFSTTDRKSAQLAAEMARLQILESDLDEHFVRAGGAGGQHVNKTSTCVVLRHRPSGLEVKSQETRSQSLNRYYARKRLCMLLDTKIRGAASAEAARIAKVRRQKRKRSKRAKEKMLHDKSHHAEKKRRRTRVTAE